MKEKNNVSTPRLVQEALDNLPHNFAVQAKAVLDKWEKDGDIIKTFSKAYILKIRKRDEVAFNADVMKALVYVGKKNKEAKEKFGITKKASPEN